MEWQEGKLQADRRLGRGMKVSVCAQAARGVSDQQKCESQAAGGVGGNAKEVGSLGLYWGQL